VLDFLFKRWVTHIQAQVLPPPEWGEDSTPVWKFLFS
jgi:hypothetical protein